MIVCGAEDIILNFRSEPHKEDSEAQELVGYKSE
jgi:hypothetical protein